MPEPSDAVVPDSHADLLGATVIAHLATVGPSGEPHSTPVWFDWDGRRVAFSTTTRRQKYRNVRRNPAVAVSIVDPANPYRYLELRGRATISDDPGNAFIDAMARKYLGEDAYPFDQPGDERVVISFVPEQASYQ
ncbi:MAG TPA: PPOX class F420-dependent oxidoreductase [Acidimicrobiales bacterium]|nr:PPOX class F420-dependent oxidoreductase [Acidimicrobiales bacterium]